MLTSIPTQFNPQSNNYNNSIFFKRIIVYKETYKRYMSFTNNVDFNIFFTRC